MNRTLIWAGSVVAAGILAAAVSNGLKGGRTVASTATPATTITVYGNSVQNVVPNQASVTVGVTDQKSTAQSALSLNSQKLSAVIDAIKAMGIPSKDFATSGLNIYPQYGNGNPGPLIGYQVQNQVTISVPSSQVGSVLDKAVSAGANQVQGVNFTSSSSSSAYQSAYQQALQNAAREAKAIASSLHQRVLRVVSVSYSSNNQSTQSTVYNAASAASGTPIMPGQQQQRLTLKVVYRLGS